MPTRLVRRCLPESLDFRDRGHVRDWLMSVVRDEVIYAGAPAPRLVRITGRYFDVLDLESLARDDPGFDPGATVALLAREASHVFVVATLAAPERPSRALLFHAASQPKTLWWAATLPFTRHPRSGLSLPDESWSTTLETEDLESLPELLKPWCARSPRGRAGRFGPPDPLSEVWAAFGSLPDSARIPTDARTLIHLAAALTLEDLLSGSIHGSVIVRVSGRDWESWIVGDDLPLPLDDAIRAIASNGTPAESVALIHLALFDDEYPPRPGLQCVAQHGEERLESWSLLSFPDEPGAPLTLAGSERWRLLPRARHDSWLRPPDDPVSLVPLDAVEA